MRPEIEHAFKFRILPKAPEEWLRAFLFLFQAYVIVAFVVRWIFSSIWVYGKTGMDYKLALSCFYDFQMRIFIGYAVCLVVLSYSGIADLIMGRWRSGCLNLFLAAFSVWMLFTCRDYAIS
jgi:hypothetical protein